MCSSDAFGFAGGILTRGSHSKNVGFELQTVQMPKGIHGLTMRKKQRKTPLPAKVLWWLNSGSPS